MRKVFVALFGGALLSVNSAYAVENYELAGENYSYGFNLYGAGESISMLDEKELSPFNVRKDYIFPLYIAAKKWASVLKAPNNNEPVTYSVLALDDYNASAMSIAVKVKESPYKVTIVNAVINGLTVDDENADKMPTAGAIFVGYGVDKENPGWQPYSGLHVLNHENLSDMHAVMLHEVMHSLGVSSAAAPYNEESGDETYYFTDDEDGAALSIFDKDLRIYTGDTDKAFKPKYEIKPQINMSIGKGEDFDVYEYSPYYVGKNTLKVLAGEKDYNKAKQAIIKNGGLTNYSVSYDEEQNYPQVFGLPIHNADDDEVDLSHLELRNSYMSHQIYRNWLVPMEAELAVLQDLGYKIELREYFGKSYYLDNISDTFTAGYSEWNGNAYTNAPSTKSQGVGLHIYGNHNNITQASDVRTVGEGAVGVRIDGIGNKYTLKNGHIIETNGVENLGLAVTWGKGHIINIENGASVVAKGEKGIAASFDFGGNLFGTSQAEKGSYIFYNTSYNDDPLQETDSALVDNFNVAGSLEGSTAAIYISDNAHVQNINIMNGAQIKGDIISEWNSVSSAPKVKVQIYSDGEWSFVNIDDEEQIYFTNLNILENFVGTVAGSIIGDEEIYNTIKLNNAGDLTVSGEKIYVHAVNNTGVINLDSAEMAVADGRISGNGIVNVQKKISTDGALETVENTINMAKDSELSTLNDKLQKVTINRLNTENTKISFDLGDRFDLKHKSASNSAIIGQVQLGENMAKELEDNIGITIFNSKNVLNFGDSAANVYYDGNRYTLTQFAENPKLLKVALTAKNVELADAAGDETAANYIVTEQRLGKDAGTVNGQNFEISGENIDVNGHKGLIINKTLNPGGTVLKTGISGASDSAISLINGGSVIVAAVDDEIVLGAKGEKAISLNNGSAELNATEYSINVEGDVVGTDNETDFVKLSGNSVVLNKIQNVNLVVNNENAYLKNTAKNTVVQSDGGTLYVLNDADLSSDGSNKIIGNGGTIYLANDKTSDIELSQFVLHKVTDAVIDVDLQNLSADKFVFKNSANIETGDNMLLISGVNFVHPNTVLSAKEYRIAFVGADIHSENLFGKIGGGIDTDIMSPIFKYDFAYKEDAKGGAFVLSRGSEKDYGSYNPAITVAPVAAQLGGYLAQINAYNQAFGNLDMQMLPVRAKKASLPEQSGLASGDKPSSWRNSAVWINPFTSYEKVDLRRGPKVRNNMYGAFVGDNSQIFSGNGWDYQYSVYAGYTGSRQRYAGNLIRQNGGNLGVTGAWYKNNFFTALTANIGANYAKAYTAYGHEHFETLLAGVASKTGYNWQLSDGKYVIQPSYTMSYTFVDTLNYKNAAGVGISADSMHVVNIAPELKAILNLQNGWQPYARAQMAWNIFDKTDFQAQHVNMPEMSVKPYVEYGVGLQKRWGEKISTYGEIMRRDGGRDGLAVQAGFSWAFGL